MCKCNPALIELNINIIMDWFFSPVATQGTAAKNGVAFPIQCQTTINASETTDRMSTKISCQLTKSAEDSNNKKHNFLLSPLQFECSTAAPDLAGGSGSGGGRLDMEEAAGRGKDIVEMKMLVSASCLPSV